MEKELEVILMVGLPASGKTTWAEDFLRKHPDYVRIGRDSFRYMLRNQGKCEVKIESMINELVEHAVLKALKYKCSVILDNTHLKASHINEIIRLVEYSANIRFQVFDIPAKVCIERDRQRDKSVGEEVIKQMDEDWQILRDSFPFQDLKRKPEWKRPRIEYVFQHELPTCVIFDIDGTLAHMKNRGPFDWDKVDRDDVIELVAEQTKFHRSAGRKIVLVSGRDEECKNLTEDWCRFYGIEFDELHMRPKGSWEKDTVVKKRIYRENLSEKYNVLCVYDDRLSVLDMWHKLGLFTFNVNQGNRDF